MKISVTQANLAKALSYIIKATAIKPNIPVLANVLISTEGGKVKLASTNLDISISTWIGGDIGEEGELTVNAKLLTEFVSQLKSAKIELIQTGQSLEVKSVDNSAQLYIITADDFPTLPDTEKEATFVINALEFSKAVQKTAIAAAIDQTRPVLTGLLLEAKQRKAALVGVDGFRLARKELKLIKGSPDDVNLIIPAKSLLELTRIIEDTASEEDNIDIFYLKDKNQVVVKFNQITFTTRLLDGEFPDYAKIIPSEKMIEVKLAKSELQDSVKIVSIFARNIIGNKVFFRINSEDKKLQLATKVLDVGNNESFIDLNSVDGDDYETAFNAKFLSDMITTIESDEITFQANGITAPGVFLDADDKDYLHIVMPMRIE